MHLRDRHAGRPNAWSGWATGLAIAIAFIPMGCDVLPPAANPTSLIGDAEGYVTLRIENLSKASVEVEAVFLAAEQEVRHTRRRLAASGTEAYEEIIPTGADTVTVIARRPVPGKVQATAVTGEVLQEQIFHRGIDYTGAGMIIFSILPEEPPAEPDPLPINDCDGNGLADETEVASDTSLDCNADGILDICQGLTDCNTNGVPDACETLADCNDDGIPDACQSLADQNENGIPDDCEIPGDLDGDGIVTMSDVSIFVSILLEGSSPPSADLNGDGLVDGNDLQALVDAVLSR